MILPGSKIGILGGGQLGKMLAISAANMGYETVIFTPKGKEQSVPAEQVSNEVIYADWNDEEKLKEFAEKVDVITFEFENIPIESIQFLEKLKPLNPSSKAIYIAQNRLRERNFFKDNNLPTHQFFEIKSANDLQSAFKELDKGILKTAAFGYDGKGQIGISKSDKLEEIWNGSGFEHAVLEEFVPFEKEISVILARKEDGEIETFPIGHNIHQNGILKKSIVEAEISDNVKKSAQDIAKKIADLLDYVGVLAVEFFITKDEQILINEIAPRVHNSGHWTVDFCTVSQFENHIRAICDLPLGEAKLLTKKAYMKNLIGDEVNDLENLLQKTTKVHLYGKKEVKAGRKMGHINYCE